MINNLFINRVLSGDGRRKVVPNFAQGLKDMEKKTLEKDMEGLQIKYTIPPRRVSRRTRGSSG